jgi:hypothetical protein
MPTDSRNYYEVLHVSRDAPTEIIRSSYRALMQQLKNHPDLGGDPATAAIINEAYAVLTNAERRVEYDARLDIIDNVAQGIGGDTIVQEQTVPPTRILDPYRECVFCETPHEHGKVIEVDAGCGTCGSPLATASNSRIEPSDQRAVSRIDKRQTITFFTRWPQSRGFVGETEDISLNGLRLVTRRELIVGQRIKIESGFIEAVATVSNCVQQRRGWSTKSVAGVSFVTLRFVRSVGGFVSDRV